MREVVVLREIKGIFEVKCPLCNTEQGIDKTNNMYANAITRCEGCGALINFQLLAIRPLHAVLENDEFDEENDITLMLSKKTTTEQITMAKQSNKHDIEQNETKVIGTQKLSIEKSAFYIGEISCPFCHNLSLVRYNAIVPHLAQWCPTESCKAELAITIWVVKQIGGNLTDWYDKCDK